MIEKGEQLKITNLQEYYLVSTDSLNKYAVERSPLYDVLVMPLMSEQ